MTSQSLFKVFKSVIMFVVLMNICSIANATGWCTPGCTNQGGQCSCPPELSSSLSLEITENDIFKYAQIGSHPEWKVIRKSEKALVPASVAEIKVGKIENRGDRSFIVNYTVRGTPQQAIIQHK